MAGRRLSGKVEMFDVKRGFGFIIPDDGSPDIFVHVKSISSTSGLKLLSPGDLVEYVIGSSRSGGRAAVDVSGPNYLPVEGRRIGGGSSGGGQHSRLCFGRRVGEIPVFMLWDIENSLRCSTLSTKEFIDNLNRALQTRNPDYVLRELRVCGGDHKLDRSWAQQFRSDCVNLGVNVLFKVLPFVPADCEMGCSYPNPNHNPYARAKEVADFFLMHIGLLKSLDERQTEKKEKTVFLIVSGDQDFTNVMTDLRSYGHEVLVAVDSKAASDYWTESDACWIWEKMQLGLPYDWIP